MLFLYFLVVSAAIGIAEQIDVMTIVVSEETSKITLVEADKINTDLPIEVLRERIKKYISVT